MSKCKVLHIVPWLVMSGMETFLFDLLNNYKKSEFEAVLIIIEDKVETICKNRLDEIGVKVICLKQKSSFNPYQKFNFFSFLKVIFKISRIMKSYKPDVVHTHLWSIKSALFPSIVNRTPVRVHTIHADVHIEGKNLGKLGIRAIKKHGFIPVAVSEYIKEKVEEAYGLKGIPLIYHGIDLEKFRHKAGKRNDEVVRLIHVGRFSMEKRHDLVVVAFNAACGVCKNLMLTLVGGGSDSGLDMIRKMVQEMGLSEKVEFLGVRNDIPDLLSESDIFIFPSYKEAFGLSVVEAMAAGLPVICSNSGALPELVKDKLNGLVIDTDKPAGLAKAIIKLANNKELREQMGKESMKTAEQFGHEAMVRNYEKLYMDLLKMKL